MTLRDDAHELQGELAVLRRALHQEPEIGLHLPRTQEKVLAALDGLPLEISTGTSLSSVTAVLRGGGTEPGGGSEPGGPVVLLRGDMDGLPVTERTGAEFTSRIDGAMHACGHDLHTAGLVGAARLLADRRERLAGDVVFMFQPGRRAGTVPDTWSRRGCWQRRGARSTPPTDSTSARRRTPPASSAPAPAR